MAASGGHWVKVGSGAQAGSMAFIPAFKEGTWTSSVSGNEYGTIEQGKLVAVFNGMDYVLYDKAAGSKSGLGEYIGTYKQEAAVQAKMLNINAMGYGKASTPSEKAKIQAEAEPTLKLGDQVTQKFFGTTPIGAAPKTKGAGDLGTKAQAAQAKATGKITAEDFAQMSSPVTVQTKYGKEITKDGLDLGNGFLITKSSKGEYYVVDKATSKTVGQKYSDVEAAHAYAQANTPYFDPPPSLSSSFTVFKDQYVAEKAMTGDLGKYYQAHSQANGYATPAIKSALKGYQNGEYGSINDHLWKGHNASSSTLSTIKSLDAAFAKGAVTPYDMVAVRSKGSGSSLYKLAKGLNVGDTYLAKGFDSSAIHYNNTWGGGQVRLVYRAPKGTPALLVNGVHGNFKAYSGENELLFSRNLKWKVVGKSVSGGNIEIHLDYDGIIQ